MNRPNSLVFGLLLAMMMAAGAAAQQPAAPEPQPATPVQSGMLTPLEVEVVISRFQGDKRVSSIPYLLAVNAAPSINTAQETQLNMGAEVPVPTTAFTSTKDGAPAAPLTSYNYRSVGTSIAARAANDGDGRFELRLNIDESSIYTSPEKQSGVVADVPVFRSFRSRNTLLLRDGQTRQYTAATDRISGETVRVEVTLRVAK